MPTCALRAPESSDSTSTRAQSHPILFVKYHERILAYARYLNGEYVFETSEDMNTAIDEDRLIVSFQFDDDMVPTGIILTDNDPRG